MKTCKKCRLWKGAKHTVFGEGPRDARVMLVGQNPGEEEDKTGRPFVGRAGKFLNKILEENKIEREKLFITNIVKHKTPGNRKLKNDEIAACLPYFLEQIKMIKPKIIVLMGETARKTPRKRGIVYLETYHPAAAMRSGKMRKKFRDDFRSLKKLMIKI